MGYYSKETSRMDIHVEEARGTILIKQKWKYSWLTKVGATNWTYPEKKLFHSKVDNLIWNTWGSSFFLKVEGNSEFAKRNSNKKWDVNFDIEWVLSSQHWDVNVTKLPSNHVGYEVSSVNWNSKIITLDTKDTAYRTIQGPTKKYYQYPVVHEFGHAAGNTTKVAGMHGDEYKATSLYFADKSSLMNLGNMLRDRHLDYILTQLNTMIAGSTFSIY